MFRENAAGRFGFLEFQFQIFSVGEARFGVFMMLLPPGVPRHRLIGISQYALDVFKTGVQFLRDLTATITEPKPAI